MRLFLKSICCAALLLAALICVPLGIHRGIGMLNEWLGRGPDFTLFLILGTIAFVGFTIGMYYHFKGDWRVINQGPSEEALIRGAVFNEMEGREGPTSGEVIDMLMGR